VTITIDQLKKMRMDPATYRRELDKLDCEESLLDFVRRGWSTIEPGRTFVEGWAVHAIAEHLEAVSRGQIKKLLMNVPPGFMKSLLTGVFWPAWEWGPRNQPHYRYVCASYSEALTIRDNMRCRALMRADFYQEMWGDRFAFNPEQDAKTKFANDRTGFKLATSVHGLGTGERGDRVIIDDPHNVLEAESDAKRENVLQWFTEVMPSRINDPDKAVFVVIMQRVHEYDVSGLILAKELGYEHLCIPMHWDPQHPFASNKKKSVVGWRDPRKKRNELAFPERYTEAAVAEMEKAMMSWGGMYAVAGQLEQRPEPRGGGMFQDNWFEVIDHLPDGPISWARGWDFASTEGGGDGSASVKTGVHHETNDLIVADCWWEQVSPGGLREHVIATLARDGYGVFQSFPLDPGQAGKYQAADFLDILTGYDFEFTGETGEKEVRARPFAAQCEVRHHVGRRVKLLRGDWNAKYKDHMTKFPKGRYKDIPDAQSRSYSALVTRGSGSNDIPGGSTLVEG
jgi:predicted phage terminase large subunit-like protein